MENLRELVFGIHAAADYLGVHHKTLLKSNQLEGIRLHDNARLFLKPQLDHYLAQRDKHSHMQRWQGDPELEALIRERLITPAQAAEMIGISVVQVARNPILRDLRIKINGRAFLFDKQEVEQYIEASRKENEQPKWGAKRKVPTPNT